MDLQVKVLRREKGKGKVDSYGRFFIYGVIANWDSHGFLCHSTSLPLMVTVYSSLIPDR